MSNHKIWFVPLKHLLQEGGAKLIPADSIIDKDWELWVESGSPFTISLESFCIVKKLDRRTGNDLLVRSWTTYGDSSPIEIVHFFKKNVAIGEIKENLAVEHIFASQNYDDKPLRLDLQILEVEGNSKIVEDIKTVSNILGAAFPAVTPFLGTGSNLLFGFLQEALNAKNPHDLAFEASLLLQGKPVSERIPFRCGAYILFMNKIEGNKYKLRDFKLELDNGSTSPELDYIVIKVIPRIINSYNTEDLLVNQRLAADLLQVDQTQVDATNTVIPKNVRRVIERVEVLKNLHSTIKQATLFDALDKYRKLKKLYAQVLQDEVVDFKEKQLYEIKEQLQEIKEKFSKELKSIIINR